MKNTALTPIHEALGAKLVPFAGYNMPVSYEGVNAEHETVRKGVGVFDVSHMGQVTLTGEGARALNIGAAIVFAGGRSNHGSNIR